MYEKQNSSKRKRAKTQNNDGSQATSEHQKSGRRRTPKQRKCVVKYHKNRKRSNINVSLSMKISMRTESEQKYCLRKKEINRKKESKMLEISIRSTSEASGQRGHHHQKREILYRNRERRKFDWKKSNAKTWKKS